MTEVKKTKENIAIIRVRGMTGVRKDVLDTLKMLNLTSKFSCVIVPRSPGYDGMIKKVKDFVTWGEISSDTIKELNTKRGKEGKKFFALHPPRRGFERKGIKKAFSVGGALGYRKEKINDLIKRMI